MKHLKSALLGYTNKRFSTAEMIAKLLELATWVRDAKNQGQDLGLSTEEIEFYDALAENGSEAVKKWDWLQAGNSNKPGIWLICEVPVPFFHKLSAKVVMKSDQLRLMGRELTEMIKKMPKLDWTQRESVRADPRRKVRRMLAIYGYPPDLSEDATQLVLRQAELSTDANALH